MYYSCCLFHLTGLQHREHAFIHQWLNLSSFFVDTKWGLGTYMYKLCWLSEARAMTSVDPIACFVAEIWNQTLFFSLYIETEIFSPICCSLGFNELYTQYLNPGSKSMSTYLRKHGRIKLLFN